MQINGRELFFGAYNERVYNKSASLEISDLKHQEAVQKLVQDAISNKQESSPSTVRPDLDTFERTKDGQIQFESINMWEKMDGVANADEVPEDDAFLHDTSRQWMVLSKNLYENGFYDNMSDNEVQEWESWLSSVTAGMDIVNTTSSSVPEGSKTGFQTMGNGMECINYNLAQASIDIFSYSSAQASMDLESSTAALRVFADKYLDGDKKEQFLGLVDQYYNHNSKALEGYRSMSENMDRFRYEHAADIERVMNFGQEALNKKQKETTKASYYLGSVEHTVEEKNAYRKQLSQMFAQIGKMGVAKGDFWQQLQDSLVNYTTKGISSQNVRDIVTKQSEATFDRMKGYWSKLVDVEN